MTTGTANDRDRVKRGQKFVHMRYLDPGWKPERGQLYADAPHAVCRITATRGSLVYYAIGEESTKGRMVCDVTSFLADVVRTWVVN